MNEKAFPKLSKISEKHTIMKLPTLKHASGIKTVRTEATSHKIMLDYTKNAQESEEFQLNVSPLKLNTVPKQACTIRNQQPVVRKQWAISVKPKLSPIKVYYDPPFNSTTNKRHRNMLGRANIKELLKEASSEW